MDGTGVPVVRKETEGRQGKADGQPAHTREAKLGCVFTQTAWDEEGFPIRDPDSTTYTGAIETAEEFGKRLYLEACQRGWSCAKKKVVMGVLSSIFTGKRFSPQAKSGCDRREYFIEFQVIGTGASETARSIGPPNWRIR